MRKSDDLLIAERTINFLLDELLLQGTLLSQKIYDMNCARIGARRNGTLIDLILYLNNPQYISLDKHFKSSTKAAIHKLGIDLLKKYFVKNSTNGAMEASTSSANQIQPSNISIRDRLKLSISEYTSLTTDAAATEPNNLKREFNWYDKNKKRTVLLDQLYDALITMQPTSTQSERNFSISNNILTKQRKRLLDKNLNAIAFVKSFFINA